MKDDIKRQIVALMRRDGLSLTKAAETVGVSVIQANRWRENDKEFGQAVNAAQLKGDIQFILNVDDLVRSGRELTEREKLAVEGAREMVDALPHMYPEEFGHWLSENEPQGKRSQLKQE